MIPYARFGSRCLRPTGTTAWSEDSSYSASLEDALEMEKLENVALWIMSGPQLPESRARVAANKMVFDAARRTVFLNARVRGCCAGPRRGIVVLQRLYCAGHTAPKARNSTSVVEQDFHPACSALYMPIRGEFYTPPHYTRQWHSRIKSAKLAGAGTRRRLPMANGQLAFL